MYFLGLIFCAAIMLYVILVDIFSTILMMTGLSREKARFQVISLLTTSGFTTRESELIMGHKVRRKIAKLIMLFGYIFTATVMSTAVSMLLSFNSADPKKMFAGVVVFLICFALLLFLRNNKWVVEFMDRHIEAWYMKHIQHGKNMIIPIEDFGAIGLYEIHMEEVPELLAGKTLSQLNLQKAHEILVLTIRHKKSTTVVAGATTVIKEGSNVVVLGKLHDVEQLFRID